jgi:CDP-glucose 4,6-dehydratase
VENMGMSKLGFWQNKRVLLTGHTGFKGTWMGKILKTLGAEVTGYALSPQSEPNLYQLSKPQINSVFSDIRDFDALLLCFQETQPEIVIHMAAQPLVLESYRQPRYTYEVNVMGTINMLECIRLTDSVKNVLNVTTDKVYLNRKKIIGYREEEHLNGHDPYANSKSCSELVTSSYYHSFFAQQKIAVSTARSGNVIGGGDFALNRLVPDCVRAASKGENIQVRNPAFIRPYLHVLDTLFAYIKILEEQHNNLSISGAYNIGPLKDAFATNEQIVSLFCEAWGRNVSWEHVPTENPHESSILTLDCSKIERTIGWTPRWDVKKTVKKATEWYMVYFNGGDFNAVMDEQIGAFLQ